MAFIPEDDKGSQESGMNVLGNQSQPQQQTQTQSGQPQQLSSGESSMIGGGAPIGSQPSQQSQGTRNKQGSGMFTNVRKYIQANQPAAQKLSGAVQGNIQQQVQDIRSQVQKQQDQFQKSLAQNQANLQQSQQFAQEAVQKAGSGQLSEQDFSRFYNLASGRQQIAAPEAMNVMDQNARAQALQNLAQRSSTEAGRQALLKQTFGNNQRYTRGQKALDALILGGNANLAKDVMQNVKGTTGGLVDEVTQARKNALQSAAQAQIDARRLPEQLQGMVTGAQGQLQQSVDTALEARRQALRDEQAAFQQALSSGQVTEEQLRRFIDQDALDRAAQQRRDELMGISEATGKIDYGRAYGSSAVGSGLTLEGLISGYGGDYQRPNASIGERVTDFLAKVKSGDPSVANADEYRRVLGYEGSEAGNIYRAANQLADLGYDQNQIANMINESLLQTGGEEIQNYVNTGIADTLQRNYSGSSPAMTKSLYEYENGRQLPQAVLNRFAEEFRTAAGRVDPNQQIQEFINAANQQRRRDLGEYVSAYDPENIRQEDVITNEMAARQQALARLAGQEITNPLQPTGREFTPGTLDLYSALRKLGVYR